MLGHRRTSLDNVGQFSAVALSHRVGKTDHGKRLSIDLNRNGSIFKPGHTQRRHKAHPSIIVNVMLVIAFDAEDSVLGLEVLQGLQIVTPLFRRSVDKISREHNQIRRKRIGTLNDLFDAIARKDG